MAIDHRRLLKKYIAHVGEYEGSTFLGNQRHAYPELPKFTDAEWLELKQLEAEGDSEPLRLELPEAVKVVEKDEVVIYIGGVPHVFYKE